MQHQQFRNDRGDICTVYQLRVGQLATNCYIVQFGPVCYVIDPGGDGTYIAETVQSLGSTPKAILLTHGHFDHVLGAFEVGSAFGIPTFVGKKDDFLVDRMQQTAEHFLKYRIADIPPKPLVFYEDARWKSTEVRIIPTPGHTPGSVTIAVNGFPIAFTGDTLFAGGYVGQTNHAYSNASDMKKSLEKLYAFDEMTHIFPGHGEDTTLYEIRHGIHDELV